MEKSNMWYWSVGRTVDAFVRFDNFQHECQDSSGEKLYDVFLAIFGSLGGPLMFEDYVNLNSDSVRFFYGLNKQNRKLFLDYLIKQYDL